MTITEFLEARIAEDEAALERTSWYPHSTHGQDGIGTYRADCPDCLGVPSKARVLAECAAKRAIVAEHPNSNVNFPRQVPICDTCHDYDHHDAIFWPCPTIKALAAVYKDHPDYDPAWA